MASRRPLSTSSGTHLSVNTGGPSGSGSISRRSSTSSAPGDQEPGPTKPKITKSRNGCITCKAKRLKCDEAKPTCLQCKKRGVECGGYRKNFKWKSFDESSFGAEGTGKARDLAMIDDTGLLPTPATPTSSSGSISPIRIRNSQTFPIDSNTATRLSLPVPQRPRGDSSSSQFTYREHHDLEHLQVPGFIGMPGQIPPFSQGSPGSYSPYSHCMDPSLDNTALGTMGTEEIPSQSAPGYYPFSQAPGGIDMQPHSPIESALGYQSAYAMGLPVSQAPYDGQHLMMNMPVDSQGETQDPWLMAHPDQELNLDDAAIQQAVADAFQTNPNQYGQDPGSHQLYRSSSHNSQ